MKRLLAVPFVALFCFGCVTNDLTPEEKAARDEQRAERRQQAQERRTEEQRREQANHLRRKYQRYHTAELKLMVIRYEELLTGSSQLSVTVNAAPRRLWEDSDPEFNKENAERVLEIERELLRRYRTGDAEAYLPKFNPRATGRSE